MVKWYWIILAVIVGAAITYFYFDNREKNIVKDVNTKMDELEGDPSVSRELVGHALARRCKCYIPPSKIVGVNGEWGMKNAQGSCISCSA